MKSHFRFRTPILFGAVLLIICLVILFAPSIWFGEKFCNGSPDCGSSYKFFAHSIWFVDKSAGKSDHILLFLGLGQLILLTGLILFVFYCARLWYLCYTLNQEQEEKKADFEEKQKLQITLNEDAEKRRLLEHERNRINDLFRLIELAKEKPEETSEKTRTKENGEVPKEIENDKTTKKDEVVNTEKLAKFIDQYNNLTSKQPNT
jgi:hypothetical protein